MRRLAEFRAVNTEDETVMNYFDELEIHPDHIGKCSKLSLIKPELGRNESKKKIHPGPKRNSLNTREVERMWDIQGR